MKVKLNKEIMGLGEYVYELKMMEENKHSSSNETVGYEQRTINS